MTFTAISILIKFYSGLLKDRGITVQQLYQDSLAKVYTLRLGGAEHVEVYNLERKTDDIKRLLEEKQRAGQEPQGEVGEGQQGEPRPTGPVPREQGGNHQRETDDELRRRERESKIKQHLSLDSLRSIHKDCKTTFKAPLVQLINKEVSGGRPEAVTFSDGLSVSPNVDPLNEEMADELNQIPLLDFLEINNAFVKGDRITLSDFEHKRIQTKGGVHLPISGPLTRPSVEKLEMISPRSLQLWGIRFPEEEEVTFSARATTANLDATIIARDQVIAEVGQTDPQIPQPTKGRGEN